MNQYKLAKWVKWINLIRPEVIWLHHHRRLWRSLDEELQPNPDAYFFREHYMRMYVSTAAITVRRLSETGKDQNSRSLALLLSDMANESDGLTAAWYGERFADTVMGVQHGREEFERLFGDGAWQLDRDKVSNDANQLKEACDSVAALADRTLAHLDNRGQIGEVTFGDLDDAVEAIGDTFRRYYMLIDGSSLASLEPAIQGDWKAPFRSPLFTSEFHQP